VPVNMTLSAFYDVKEVKASSRAEINMSKASP
jgi:hypothetical protein